MASSSVRCPGVLRVGEEGRRKEEERRRRREKKEKKKKKMEKKRRERKRERDAAGFAAAVDARARRLQSEATRTRNEKRGNKRMGIEFGCRNCGSSKKDFLDRKEFGK